jgi:enterochelin esterase-like enzyme
MKPLILGIVLGLVLPVPETAPPRGRVERVVVHGASLEGNLEGDSPDRSVSIYLPPSYETHKERRYPVLYMLHGFTDTDELWFGPTKHWINLPSVLDRAWRGAGAREVIVAMPSAFTRYEGSMYSSSPVTGDWEEFIRRELVAFVDAHYRTLPRAESRALAGHSMGGYGSLRIGMKSPEVFSSLYLLSPCCLTPRHFTGSDEDLVAAEAIRSPKEVAEAEFGTKILLASAAAWSPDPQNTPLLLALPSRHGEIQAAVLAKWTANAPLAVIDQHIGSLRRLRGLAFDAGGADEGIAASIRELDSVLNAYQVPHAFEIYDGDHLNRIAERIETKVVPFLSKNLVFDAH